MVANSARSVLPGMWQTGPFLASVTHTIPHPQSTSAFFCSKAPELPPGSLPGQPALPKDSRYLGRTTLHRELLQVSGGLVGPRQTAISTIFTLGS